MSAFDGLCDGCQRSLASIVPKKSENFPDSLLPCGCWKLGGCNKGHFTLFAWNGYNLFCLCVSIKAVAWKIGVKIASFDSDDIWAVLHSWARLWAKRIDGSGRPTRYSSSSALCIGTNNPLAPPVFSGTMSGLTIKQGWWAFNSIMFGKGSLHTEQLGWSLAICASNWDSSLNSLLHMKHENSFFFSMGSGCTLLRWIIMTESNSWK